MKASECVRSAEIRGSEGFVPFSRLFFEFKILSKSRWDIFRTVKAWNDHAGNSEISGLSGVSLGEEKTTKAGALFKTRCKFASKSIEWDVLT